MCIRDRKVFDKGYVQLLYSQSLTEYVLFYYKVSARNHWTYFYSEFTYAWGKDMMDIQIIQDFNTTSLRLWTDLSDRYELGAVYANTWGSFTPSYEWLIQFKLK